MQRHGITSGNNGSYLAGLHFCFAALQYTQHWYLMMNNIRFYWNKPTVVLTPPAGSI